MMHSWGFGGGGMGMGGMRGGYQPQRFEEQYHCHSVAFAGKSHLEGGDKILLPPSAFDTLARLQVDYPMLFQLSSPTQGTVTHCGVLEFTAEEGSCYIPFWMMQNLLIEEGTVITVKNVSLPKATFVKLQPQHVDFLEISNPRAVLEHALRNYSCVTKGDVICLPYNNKNYHFQLKEVKPQDAACIIETDCNVDFDAPVGYKEPVRPSSSHGAAPASGNSSIASGGGSSIISTTPKQSATGGSACPSPTPSSMSGTSSAQLGDDDDAAANRNKIRIVDGQIIKPDEDTLQSSGGIIAPENELVAKRTGQSGVQRNAAVADVKAPTIDYWAINAGDGARLDGKKPAVLKDRDGTELDVRKIRAEAAAKRAEAAAKRAAELMPKSDVGITVSGTKVQLDNSTNGKSNTSSTSSNGNQPTVSKRKSRVAGKYSRLKTSAKAFEGSSNKM